MTYRSLFLKLATFLLASYCSVCPAFATEGIYSQPWIVNSTSFAMVAFGLQPEDVKKYLPLDLRPLVNDKGKVNTTLEVYSTERIAGLPAYKIAFIVVEVANHPSRTGMPGHFAIWGRVDSASSLSFFTREFGFPYKLASYFDIKSASTNYSVVLGDEIGELFNLQIQPILQAPFKGDGVVDMLSLRKGKNLVKAEVSYLTSGYFGQVLTLKARATGEPILALLNEAAVEWSLVADNQIFAYSHVLSVEHGDRRDRHD